MKRQPKFNLFSRSGFNREKPLSLYKEMIAQVAFAVETAPTLRFQILFTFKLEAS